jgi:hypothetical protein
VEPSIAEPSQQVQSFNPHFLASHHGWFCDEIHDGSQGGDTLAVFVSA